ncbi:hypothetical protein JTE90_005580 [Oedothorax gibbosus]|uniref:VWFA and cache domain-containing protein 1 n=1 Tax=Oedothorax gibbosus TaxID=931172 RepID=A0AAV6VC46_9ARAC|nr:hypothetical protein JTE90_005580 [Oedothorax gibbosus]
MQRYFYDFPPPSLSSTSMPVKKTFQSNFSFIPVLLFYLSFTLFINPYRCKNVSFSLQPSHSMLLSYEKDSEELSHQKNYVMLLNAKLLAQERERLEKTLQNSFSSPVASKQFTLGQGSYYLNPGKTIGSSLRKISNDELCITKMQAIYDTLPSVEMVEDINEILEEVSYKLSRKIKEYIAVVGKNKEDIENTLSSQEFRFDHTDIACCHLDPHSLSYNEHFGADITFERGCMTFPYSHVSASSYIGKNFSSAFKVNFNKVPSLLWQYFISLDGAHFEYPGYHLNSKKTCDQKTDRHRQIYLDTIKSKTKYVIIAMDQGNSLSLFQFGGAKIIGKHILGLLSSHDKVTVFGLASEVQQAQGSNCTDNSFLYATSETKLELTRFFDNLTRKHNATDHVLGFRKIYEMIREIDKKSNSTNNEILVTYISRGLLSSLVDAKQVLEIISDGNRKTKNHIVINTYALIDDDRPVMYEKDFLQDIAQQNFRKYSIYHKASRRSQKGVMIPINTTKNIALTIGDIFKDFPQHMSSKPIFSLPYFDSMNKGMIVSISQQVFHRGNVAGVTGVDISLADLAEDVSYLKDMDSLYIFLMDESGTALTHPSFSHPSYANWHHIHTYVWHLEDKLEFQKHYKEMLSEPNGQITIPFKVPKTQGANESSEEKFAIYTWKKVEGTPYIVCVVVIEPTRSRKVLKEFTSSGHADFSYHRIDMLSMPICRHMKQLSSLGTTAVFLSASCFNSPYKFLREEETPDKILSYMAFLKDPKNVVTNPGLKAGVRNEVLALSQITTSWKQAATHPEFSNFVVRRFIATHNGVFQVYPATLIDKSFDPTRRDWYMRALEHPGKIILTAPYLDVGGAGYVITLSHTVFEGKPTALHSVHDNVVAVMGMDFTFGYFYKFLLEKIPSCKLDHMICFLLDDKGYLIAHPDLIDPSGRGPVEQQHITHKEPLVANDLLNHRAFVTKKVCASYSDRTIQRYYQLNISLDTVLTNLVHGEHCTKYQTDRLCLNCHRMEPTECECPCECPLKMDLCTGHLLNDNHYPTCPHYPELPNLPVVNLNTIDNLQPCYDHHCTSRQGMSECFGVLGCEWCQLDSDGISPLPEKFCTDQRKCFGGVLGSRTPYSDEILDRRLVLDVQFLVIKSTPVGPVAGVLMTAFILVAFLVYYFRSRRHQQHPYPPASSDTSNFRMTHMGSEQEQLEQYNEPMDMVSPLCRPLVPHMENIASPYRVASNYRRPAGGDSDHGYSTMTPHEDSELAYSEPLLTVGPSRRSTIVSGGGFSSGSTSPVSCAPSTTVSVSPSVLKMESGMPAWWPPRKDNYVMDRKVRKACVMAHAQVHSEGANRV